VLTCHRESECENDSELDSRTTGNSRFESGKFPPLATKFPKISVVEKRSK